MNLLRCCLLCLFALAMVAQASAADPSPQKSVELNRNVKITMNYLLYLPKDYDQKESWPVLLFLHGAGERGDNLDRVKQHGLPKLIEAGQAFPFIVVSPQCAEGKWWDPSALAALLDEIVEKYKVDRDRVYVTGSAWAGSAPGRWPRISPTGSPRSCRSVAVASPEAPSCSPRFRPGRSTARRIRPCRSIGPKAWSTPSRRPAAT